MRGRTGGPDWYSAMLRRFVKAAARPLIRNRSTDLSGVQSDAPLSGTGE